MLAQVDDRAGPVVNERQLVKDEQPVTGCVRPEAQYELDRLPELVGGLDGLEREEAGPAGVPGGDALGDQALGEGRLAGRGRTRDEDELGRPFAFGFEDRVVPD